jgi:NADPH:quinone reductase-like Zn-dependent oxidoreductase
MRALRIHGYGGLEVLCLEDVASPVPGKGQLLVKVRAASVNPIDWKMRKGLLAGLFPLSFPRTLGRDCAGDAGGGLVAGVADMRTDGTHAEFALLPESQLAPVPAGLDAAAAASLCVAGLSALIPLVEIASLKKGSRILIHAGAGGVGSLAIQIARHLGAEVHVTASAANRDYCLSLGAARVIDYHKENFLNFAPYDVVLDTLGGETHLRSMKALKMGGLLVALAAAPIPKNPAPSDIKVVMAQIQPSRERLARIFEWAASGVIRPQVTRRFSLEEGKAAYAASESGHGRGKIVLEL